MLTSLPPRAIYPISYAVLEHNFDMFAAFSTEVLNAVEANNSHVLPGDDPVRFLLAGESRRVSGGHRLAAYRAGVLIGSAIVRTKLSEMGEDFHDYHMPADGCWREHDPIDWPERSGVRFVLRQFFDSPYDTKALLKERVEDAWIKNHITFLRTVDDRSPANDWVAIGMGDICALYGALRGMRDFVTEDLVADQF